MMKKLILILILGLVGCNNNGKLVMDNGELTGKTTSQVNTGGQNNKIVGSIGQKVKEKEKVGTGDDLGKYEPVEVDYKVKKEIDYKNCLVDKKVYQKIKKYAENGKILNSMSYADFCLPKFIITGIIKKGEPDKIIVESCNDGKPYTLKQFKKGDKTFKYIVSKNNKNVCHSNYNGDGINYHIDFYRNNKKLKEINPTKPLFGPGGMMYYDEDKKIQIYGDDGGDLGGIVVDKKGNGIYNLSLLGMGYSVKYKIKATNDDVKILYTIVGNKQLTGNVNLDDLIVVKSGNDNDLTIYYKDNFKYTGYMVSAPLGDEFITISNKEYEGFGGKDKVKITKENVSKVISLRCSGCLGFGGEMFDQIDLTGTLLGGEVDFFKNPYKVGTYGYLVYVGRDQLLIPENGGCDYIGSYAVINGKIIKNRDNGFIPGLVKLKETKEEINENILRKNEAFKNSNIQNCLISKEKFRKLIKYNSTIDFGDFIYYCIPKTLKKLDNKDCYKYQVDKESLFAEVKYCIKSKIISISEGGDGGGNFIIKLIGENLILQNKLARWGNGVGEFPYLGEKIIKSTCNINNYKCIKQVDYICKFKGGNCKEITNNIKKDSNYKGFEKIIKEKCRLDNFDVSKIPTKEGKEIQINDECNLEYHGDKKYILIMNNFREPAYYVYIKDGKITKEGYEICGKWFKTLDDFYNLTGELAVGDLTSDKCKFINISSGFKYSGYYAEGIFLTGENINQPKCTIFIYKGKEFNMSSYSGGNIVKGYIYDYGKNKSVSENVNIKYFDTKYGKSYLLYKDNSILTIKFSSECDGSWKYVSKTFFNGKEIK